MSKRKNTPQFNFDQLVRPAETLSTIAALLVTCGDVGCDWLSSAGSDRETNLTEVCGGSGWYHRPRRKRGRR